VTDSSPSAPSPTAEGRRAPFGIRARLSLLVVVALAPLTALIAVQYVRSRGDARIEAERRTGEVARLISAHLDEFALRVEMLLQAAALQVRLDPPDIAHNDSVLTSLASRTMGTLGTLNVRDTADRLLGTSFADIRTVPRLATRGRRYFEQALRTGRFAVGEPVRARVDSTMWVVSFGLPVRGRDGAIRGVAFSTARVDSLRGVLDQSTLPPGSNVTVVDVDGRIIFRTLETTRFVGQNVRALPSFGPVFATSSGTHTAPSELDGVERVRAWRRLQRAPWTVVVGIPLDIVMAEETRSSRRDAIVAALSLGVALLLAALVAGRILRPVVSLTADAQAIARGDLSRRSNVAVGGEIGLLAEQFNAMSRTLEEQTGILKESEERYRTLFELSPLPMVLADTETLDLLVVNKAALDLYGYSREEMLSLNARDIRPAEDLPAFEAAIRDGSSQVSQRRATHLTKNGERLDVEVSIARTSAFGRGVWLAVINDLSARERTEAALRESQDQVRQMQKIEAVGSLAAGIAHDFNNLLTGILGSADLALLSLPESHPAHVELRHARDSALRATELTKRLLSFSRQQASARERVDLRDVVLGMQPLFARTLGEQVKLDLRTGSEPCPVHVDPGQIEQVLLNLLVNARDAMPKGGVATVDVRLLGADDAPNERPDGHGVLLSVTDTGTGMDEATAARVFDAFFTTKERGKGTGLGLATAHRVVRNAGGQIRLRTAPGAGSTFRVTLPLDASGPAPRPSPEHGVPAAAEGETVLLVEDDDAVRRVVGRMLESLGYEVLSAEGPRAALQLARDHIGPIDLVLSDVIMPGMNGREMAEAIQKLRPQIRIVYASGYTDDVALLHQLRASALFFLQKPFTAESLGRMLRSALETPPEGVAQ
jgi:PAS domain S-box-containing protein